MLRALIKRIERRASIGLVHILDRYKLAQSVLCVDIRKRLPRETFATIFDVGANRGQSAAKFLVDFPNANLICFEPSPDTFAGLLKRFSGEARVEAVQTAVGSIVGEVRFSNPRAKSVTHRIASTEDSSDLPVVPVTTLDVFCRDKGIKSVDLLKIDTEGHDLEVLKGARDLLNSAEISMFVAECTPNPDNAYHVQLADIHALATSFGYRMFGVYEQHPEWPTNKPHLRRVDAAYVSPAVIARSNVIAVRSGRR
jgi:FkbM family methyltransferase